MDQQRFKCILSLLEQHELTLRERQFVEAVEEYFNENGKVTAQQESVLEGIYREKVWIRRACLSQGHLLKNPSSKATRIYFAEEQRVGKVAHESYWRDLIPGAGSNPFD